MILINPNLRDKFYLYNKSKLALDEYLDISYIIQKLEELEKLKFVCLNINQLAVFNYISKDICTLSESNPLSAIKRFKEFNNDSIKLAQTIASFKNRVINFFFYSSTRMLLLKSKLVPYKS